MERTKIENGNTYIIKTDPVTGIESTSTHTTRPKLTISKGRVALKFHHELSEADRAPYFKYAEQIAKMVGEPEFTLRGKFGVDSDTGIEYLRLTTKGKKQKRPYSFRITDGEVAEFITEKPLTSAVG